MQLYNIKDPSEKVNFAQAVRRGLGRGQGLFFPSEIRPLEDIDALLRDDLVTRSSKILRNFLGDELPDLDGVLKRAFTFPAPLAKVTDDVYALELFHGPTLAFKDFGGRFMAQALQAVSGGEHITILTATSGDTGAAVAHAFYGVEGIDVVILYPKGKISNLQEKLFCTLGGNIRTVAVNGTFDDCQALVKRAFDDEELKKAVGLNSANSINISRLLAQICYYFEAYAQLPEDRRSKVVFSVPSGNFGDVTAGLLAKACGLPVSRFVIATNANDTVPRYLASGRWEPRDTIPTLSNAMDVSRPNNWPRVEELFRVMNWNLSDLTSGAVDDAGTEEAMRKLKKLGYISEPHGSIAWSVLSDTLAPDETGIFLCTAAPAKFKESVDRILDMDLPLPPALADRADMKVLSDNFDPSWELLRKYLLRQD